MGPFASSFARKVLGDKLTKKNNTDILPITQKTRDVLIKFKTKHKSKKIKIPKKLYNCIKYKKLK